MTTKSSMVSKFSSKCRGCGGQIRKGEMIVKNQNKVWVCANCGDGQATAAPGYAIGARTSYRSRRGNGMCEDAPCCGCCGPQGDGDYYGMSGEYYSEY